MRHPTQMPATPILAQAVERAIDDGMSPHYIIGFLTAAIRNGATEQQTAKQLDSNVIDYLANTQAPR